METEDKLNRLFDMVSPSVVIVSNGKDYCVGFIVVATENVTFVVTQSTIVKSDGGNPIVHFSEKSELVASVEVVGDQFCLLKTGHHARCKAIDLMEADVQLSVTTTVLTIAPAQNYAFYSFEGSILLETRESYGTCFDDYIDGSEKEFIASCNYSELSYNGERRIIGAPVFDMDGKVLGIIVGDYGYVAYDGKRSGFEMKIVLFAKHVSELRTELVESEAWCHRKCDKNMDWKTHLQCLGSELKTGKRKRCAGPSKGG